MKLDERDIKAVATSRFWREQHRAWKIAGMLLGTLCLSVALTEVTESILSMLPVAIAFAVLIWVAVKADRYVANLVAEWKESIQERLWKRK